MNPFPHASQDFQNKNPDIFGQQEAKNDSTGILARPRGIHEKMNDTEAKFALRLEGMKREGRIEDWKFESIRLRLADRTTYTPDFFTVEEYLPCLADGTSGDPQTIFKFIEIKGFRRDDAMVKFKVAREQYPWAEFQMWSLTKEGWKQVL